MLDWLYEQGHKTRTDGFLELVAVSKLDDKNIIAFLPFPSNFECKSQKLFPCQYFSLLNTILIYHSSFRHFIIRILTFALTRHLIQNSSEKLSMHYILDQVLFSAELNPRGYYLEYFWQADLHYIEQAIIGVKVPNSSHVACIQHLGECGKNSA